MAWEAEMDTSRLGPERAAARVDQLARKITAQSVRDGSFLSRACPALIGLTAVSGGFNCVVQVAASYCRRVWGAVPAGVDVPIPTVALKTFIADHAKDLSDSLRAL